MTYLDQSIGLVFAFVVDRAYPDATETHLKLAFKAQSQCRTTLETLAEIKSPRSVAFVRQANTSAGPQQLNNGTGATITQLMPDFRPC